MLLSRFFKGGNCLSRVSAEVMSQKPYEEEEKISWKQVNFALSSALSGRRECWKVVSSYRDKTEENNEFWKHSGNLDHCKVRQSTCWGYKGLWVCACVCVPAHKEFLGVGFQVWLLVNAECYPNMAWGQSSSCGNWILNKILSSCWVQGVLKYLLEPNCPCKQPLLLSKEWLLSSGNEPCLRFVACACGEKQV